MRGRQGGVAEQGVRRRQGVDGEQGVLGRHGVDRAQDVPVGKPAPVTHSDAAGRGGPGDRSGRHERRHGQASPEASPAPPAPLVPPTPHEAEALFGDQRALAERYVALLADTGISHGLIGPREGPRLWDRHVVNCGLVSPLLAHGTSVADLGSGAGLPGLVLALMRPDLTVHLVEPLHRRIVWLERTVADLGLDNVTLHEARAEALDGELEVDYVTARAVARLDKLGRWAVPFLPRGGQMLALKGESAAQELTEDLPKLQRSLPGRVDSAEVVRCGEGVVEHPTLVVRIVFTPAPPVSGRHRPTRRGPAATGRPRRPR
ncbi:MAG: 16S rRNA (guanine(527)-N(7))-methyltransferase RsmG [Dermatophilaceae bacterium]